MTLKQAIIQTMKQNSKPMRSREIKDYIEKNNLFHWVSWIQQINACISTDINSNTPEFMRIEPWIYYIHDEYANINSGLFTHYAVNQSTTKPDNTEVKKSDEVSEEIWEDEIKQAIDTDDITSNKAHIWIAWEYSVCSELLLRSYQAMLVSVDSWTDIIALKNNMQYNIQVKTSITPKTHSSWVTYTFSIRKNIFNNNGWQNMYYIFVSRIVDNSYSRYNFLILNHANISHFINVWDIQETQWWYYIIWVKYHNSWEVTIWKSNVEYLLNDWWVIN